MTFLWQSCRERSPGGEVWPSPAAVGNFSVSDTLDGKTVTALVCAGRTEKPCHDRWRFALVNGGREDDLKLTS